jgi:murein DD-endopeptidase MepM/ murein hydrolase activator NlpD
VLKIAKQEEMGNTIYIEDAWGAIHAFAHFTSFDLLEGHKVKRGDIIGRTGNTGTATTYRHVHYEVITKKLHNPKEDYHLVRKLFNFTGYNTDPIKYLKELYAFHGVDWKTGLQAPGHWINAIKRTIYKIVPYPKWLNIF